jgi:hypothetical protein
MLVDDNAKLGPARGISLRTLRELNLVQECATWLHDALSASKAGWSCACEEPHPVNIQLDEWSPHAAIDRKGNQVCFSLLFAEDARNAHYGHWMSAEITTLRPNLENESPVLLRNMSNTQADSPSAQSVTRFVQSLGFGGTVN